MTATVATASLIPWGSKAHLRDVDLRGPAGRLEAVVNSGSPDAHFAALVCHPHPKGGGSLHNKVVYRAMKVLNAPEFGFAAPVLRFNFRGTGWSEGEHDGRAESDDVLAALDWLRNEFSLPLVAVGFSFGAAMVLKAASEDRRGVRAIAALGLPTHAGERTYRYRFLRELALPKLFLSGDCDQFAPLAELEQVVLNAPGPKHLKFVPGADHFFTGRLEAMQHALAEWLEEYAP
jgi:hypothetical protein